MCLCEDVCNCENVCECKSMEVSVDRHVNCTTRSPIRNQENIADGKGNISFLRWGVAGYPNHTPGVERLHGFMCEHCLFVSLFVCLFWLWWVWVLVFCLVGWVFSFLIDFLLVCLVSFVVVFP